ncbi:MULTISPECIES: SH3 domain-containing protein [Streptomyces]|uniref:SH3 domain-containing protein n=1 Tax=Streptomyces TaxID=1883 RepID=UPI00073DFEBD|nr:SH3 domain-containing protein [Streptomyces sp. EAS-AB2608]MYU29587.1 SH3 domain-containing protein [Streptomyces sp. SID7810]BCM69014.1 hypothetical protein EASAB2608_04348 [Streptomyces sp. EAS-AB2608]CUW30646.1 hypothetical protein TUE45_05380 [Streptomyces reticuli]
MGRKALRTLAFSAALATGVGLVGASAASAVILDPGYSSGNSAHSSATYPTDRTVFKSATVNGLRVRTGPGMDRGILGLIYDGEPVQVITSARDGGGQRWDKVMLQRDSAGGLPAGYVGWVSEMYLY